MEKAKDFYKSKRFWALLATLVAGIGLCVTGEESITEALPEIITTILAIVTGFLGLSSNSPVAFGSRVLGKSKK